MLRSAIVCRQRFPVLQSVVRVRQFVKSGMQYRVCLILGPGIRDQAAKN